MAGVAAPCVPTDGTALAAVYSGRLRIGVARPLSLVELQTDGTERHGQAVLKRWDFGTSESLVTFSVSDGQLWLSRKNEVQRHQRPLDRVRRPAA